MTFARWFRLWPAALLFASVMSAQDPVRNERPVRWSARVTHPLSRSGDTARVSLRATIDEFFHLYSTTQGPGGPVRTTVELIDSHEWAIVGRVRAPAPDTIPDGNFGIMSEVYDDSVTLGVSLVGRTGVVPTEKARVGVRYQACTTRYCLPPRTDTFAIALGSAGEVAAAPTVIPSGENRAEAAFVVAAFGGADSPGAFLLLALSMGALALLTPCVFPMVPITIASFIAVADDRARAVRRAAQYALGIVASFALLGLVTSALFGATGLARFSASPIVNLAIAVLFILFALSMLGAINLALPSALSMRLSNLQTRGGGAGTIALGALFTLTTFTCTAPFVGTLLVMSAQGSWRWPLVGMLVFASVFAAPFFVLALVPGLLRKRPRAGDWMPTLETIVAFFELAAAVKFVSNADLVFGWGILTRGVVIATWIAIFVALVVTLLWRARPRFTAFRVAASAVIAALAASLVPGLFGRGLGELEAFLPPNVRAATVSTVDGEPTWLLNDFRGALATATREGRPVLIDFTGYTCTNCRWMEANMFPRAAVNESLERFVRVRLYTDGLGEPYLSQQKLEQRLFGTVALPFYAVLDASGRPRATFLGMTRDAREFTAFLDRGANALAK